MVWHGPRREFEPFFEEPCGLPPEERPNVFTASVGNLLPGQELTVELTWVEAPAREGEAIRFALPTVVACTDGARTASGDCFAHRHASALRPLAAGSGVARLLGASTTARPAVARQIGCLRGARAPRVLNITVAGRLVRSPTCLGQNVIGTAQAPNTSTPGGCAPEKRKRSPDRVLLCSCGAGARHRRSRALGFRDAATL